MPFDLQWDDEHHTTLRIDIRDPATWEQYHDVITQVVEQIQRVSYRVDIIIHDDGKIPSGGDAVSHLKASISQLASCPNLGLVVTVHQNPFARAILDLALRLLRKQGGHFGGFADSLDTARQIVAKNRALSENLESS
ncbi:MAG: hypothetical protein ABI690_25420 [Chloroflexota bacterium]